MPSNYSAIRDQHLEDYGHKKSWRQSVLADRYSERTHFVYELLQNAEDAGATRVEFLLLEDRLEVRHDGRDFNPLDVSTICAIAESTKPDDAAMIGRFGIGFKSVYAYTRAPQVHCPGSDEYFEIRDFVEPWPLEPRQPGGGWTTLFVFPFDREEPKSAQSVEEISDRLVSLSPRTVLFLRHLRELEWKIAGSGGGTLLRDQTDYEDARRVRLLHSDSGTDVDEEWLVFDRPVHLVEGRVPSRVELAFLLATDDQGSERVVTATDTELVAFFPTSRETHLGFLLQAPFVLTPARDNVRDSHPVNQQLAVEAGELLVEALEHLRDRGLLDVAALQCLPLNVGAFPEGNLLRPLYDAVRRAMLTKPLLPTADGRHLPAAEVRLARSGGLRELFSPRQLGSLLGKQLDISWASAEISADRTQLLHRFLAGYEPRWTWSGELKVPSLVAGFDVDLDAVIVRLTEGFLADQDDAWMVHLYRLLAERGKLNDLRTRPIVRRKDGAHVSAFDVEGRMQIWLPSGEETSFPTVSGVIAADEGARAFLERLGLDEPDLVDDVIRSVLPRYAEGGNEEGHYQQDVARIARALEFAKGEKRERLLRELGELRFLVGRNAATDERIRKLGHELYEPTPALSCFHGGNPAIWFLDDACHEQREHWREIGVRDDFEVQYRQPRADGRVPLEDRHGHHERGVDGFDPDFSIDGFEYALDHPTSERSILAWELLSRLGIPLRGQVEHSRNQHWNPSRHREEVSPVGETATSRAWLLNRDGDWRRPEQLSVDDLDEVYLRDRALALTLGMVSSSRQDIAAALGLDEELADELMRDREGLREYLQSKRAARQRAPRSGGDAEAGGDADEDTAAEVQPGELDVRAAIEAVFNRGGLDGGDEYEYVDGRAADPERRRDHTEGELIARKAGEPGLTERQRPVNRQEWEARDPVVRAYLLNTYGGRCQICDLTFRRRDGEPYFEARYLVPRTAARWVDHPGNALCLCATCFAKLLHGTVEGAAVFEQINKIAEEAADLPDGASIRFELCGKPVEIRFAQRHLIDVGALLAVAGQAADDECDAERT